MGGFKSWKTLVGSLLLVHVTNGRLFDYRNVPPINLRGDPPFGGNSAENPFENPPNNFIENGPRKRPNIVVILADDMGWSDASFTGSGQIPTPNLDALASAGIVLRHHYVQPFCTPSRAALLTGMYPINTGMQHYVIRSREPWGLPLNFKLLPEHLKDLGYTNHMVGKWHLGQYREEYLPTQRGFDSHLGYYNGYIDYYTHNHTAGKISALDFWKDGKPFETNDYATRVFTERAEEIIQNHNTEDPLFLYMAHLAVHRATEKDPFQAPAETTQKFAYVGDPNRTKFAAMLAELDDSVGKMVSALAKKRMLENTIIVFSSDNGGQATQPMENTGTNFPLRGQKRTLFEGGTRVPAFIWSPLLSEQRRMFDGLIHMVDWLPTLYHAAGGDVRQLGRIDGYNIWPSLSDGVRPARNEIVYNIDPVEKFFAIRVGRFKLIYGNQYNLTGWYDGRGFSFESLIQLERMMDKSLVAKTLDLIGYWWKGPRQVDTINTASWKWRESARINCGDPESITYCDPGAHPCLFDLVADPCEYNNIISGYPAVARFLLGRLMLYSRQAHPINNQPDDTAFFPNSTWGPWIR